MVVGTLFDVTDADARLANDLSLAVLRLARQLRFRRPDSPVSLSQLSALATLSKDGPMTPGALAVLTAGPRSGSIGATNLIFLRHIPAA